MRIALFTAVTLCMFSLAAHADTFTTYNLTSTFNSPGNSGMINGTLTFDNTTGMFSAANAVSSGFPATNGSNDQPLNTIQFQSVDPNNGEYGVLFGNSTGSGVFLDLPTSNFSGATLSICTISSNCMDGATAYSNTNFSYMAISGSLTNASAPTAVTPEPSSLALFGTGLFGLAGVVRKRFA